MIIVIALHLLGFLVQVRADYGCLCIRGGDSVIYYQPFLLSQVLGQLKDGDCKPTFLAGTSANWTAIQFHNQVGFITVTSAVRFYNCQGNPLDTDAFSTSGAILQATSTKQTTSSTTLMKLTTTGFSSTEATTKVTSTPSPRKTTPKRTSSATTTTTLRKTSVTAATRVSPFGSTRVLHCPPQVGVHGYHHLQVNGRCYEFIMTPHKNWPDAEHDCNTRGGHLVSIGSMAEQNVVFNQLKRQHFYYGDKDVWIGLTDQASEGRWQWSSGDRTMFTFWDSGEPAGFFTSSYEDCAMLEMDRNGHWGGVSCTGVLFSTEKHGYICEYNLV